MNKKLLIIFSCIVLLLSSGAIAADGPYMSGNVGADWLSNSDIHESDAGITVDAEMEFDASVHLGASAGYDFGDVRVEGEFGYRNHDIDEIKDFKVNGFNLGDFGAGGDITSLIFLANGFYDIDTGTSFTPYVGGGIGVALLDIDDFTIAGIKIGDEDDTVFAYQGVAGIGYALSDSITADLSYRFLATSDPDFDGTEGEYQSHNLMAAIRFYFK